MNRLAPITPASAATVNEALLRQLAAKIREEIPEAEVSLLGSHARGEARPDSAIDLLITVTHDWLRHHSRFEVLDRLRWRPSEPIRPVDRLLFSRSQVEQRRQLRCSVVDQAYTQRCSHPQLHHDHFHPRRLDNTPALRPARSGPGDRA
jgi:predicted nucleotidyltransferase